MKRILTLLGLALSTQFAVAQQWNCTGLTAGINATANNLTVQFANTSSNSNVPPVVKLAFWSFGDGSSSTSLNPSHTYTVAGTYNVMLINTWYDTLWSSNLCIDTAYTTVTVPNGNPSVNEIVGKVYWDTTGGNPAQIAVKVWLIEYDAIANTLTAVDSLTSGGYMSANYTFSNKPAGAYRTKAAEIVNGMVPASYMPTYHDSSLYWGTAMVIAHAGGTTVGNIWMKAGNPGTGPGFIGGNVAQGANKGTNGGISNVLVFLRNASNGVVEMTYTNSNGDYSFSALPVGSYNIYPEAMNYTTTPSSLLTISTGQASVTNVDFERSITNQTITPKTTAINDVAGNNLFSISPNPSSGLININWKAGTKGNATVTLFDVSGRTVAQENVNMYGVYQLNASSLQQGLYFVKINAGSAQYTERVMISK